MSLERSFFARPALAVAPDLLGCRLSHGGVTVRLTEVEAYTGEGVDPGSHAFRGRTPRTEVSCRTRSQARRHRANRIRPDS